MLFLYTLQVLVDVLNVDSDVTDSEHDCPTEILDAQLTALFEFVVQAEQPVASCVEMARILENVEAD